MPDSPSLLHPVYLDVPMMVSFLASLEGGVAFEDETTRSSRTTTSRERSASGGVRIPALSSLLGFDASGRMGKTDSGEQGEETKVVRQHTAASLFNSLHDALTEGDLVNRIESVDVLEQVNPGDVVEICGEFVGNPLEEVLAFIGQALPYLDISQEDVDVDPEVVAAEAAEAETLMEQAQALEEQAAEARRSGSPAKQAAASELEQRAAETKANAESKAQSAMELFEPLAEKQNQEIGLQLLVQMKDDLTHSPVHDMVIRGPGFDAVLTLASEFFTDAANAFLRAGVFRVVGKATRVLQAEDQINLARRTVLGAAGPDLARDLLQGIGDNDVIQLETVDPIVEDPAVQILPLAVYL